ncbi:hypothetical protein V5O48_008075 [Marasmius crinis-equi]|uniref:DarT domain-containing protein n=1 Tax=Marasmius crinis-equi TaxID=585013 RepID=A0ABR3FFB5_9AGAR
MATLTESPLLPTRPRYASDELRFLQHTPPAFEYHGDIFHLTNVHHYISDFVGAVSNLGIYRILTDIRDFIKTHPSVIFGTVIHPNKPVNIIFFNLRAEFTADPSTFSPPVYLFHRMLKPEIVNGVLQLDTSLFSDPFYWSLDPDGGQPLPEERLKDHGITKFDVTIWLGRCWEKSHYAAVREYLRLENQEPIQFARDHGYPILQKWEEGRFKAVNDGQSDDVESENENDEYHSCEE